MWLLNDQKSIELPNPPQMHNKGNYIVSLANVVRWLAQQVRYALLIHNVTKLHHV